MLAVCVLLAQVASKEEEEKPSPRFFGRGGYAVPSQLLSEVGQRLG